MNTDTFTLPRPAATRLMIVDDNEETGSGLAAFFRHHGFQAIAFADGRLALKQLRNEPADLVIIDLFMPEFDGFEFMRELKKLPLPPRMIAMTGGVPHMLKVARILGVEGLVAKPFEPALLLEQIREILARPRRAKLTEA